MTHREHDTERRPLLSEHSSLNSTDDRDEQDTIRNVGQPPELRQPSRNHAQDEEEPEELSTGQLLRIMSGVYLAATLSSLDGTLIATLVTPISNSFHAGTSFAWLASAYFIANAASQPLAGKLSDIYGRKTGMIVSNFFFGVGNLICGLARSESTIIAGRIVAGFGGGGIGPIATSLASDLVPLRRRGLWQGFSNICYGIGSSLGGPVGGLIHDTVGWRWAFLFQVPLTVVTIVLVISNQNSPMSTETNASSVNNTRWKRVDFAGAVCLVSSLVLMLIGLNAAGNVVPWNHPLVLFTLPISALLLLLFIYTEQNVAREPIIPMHLLTRRTILSACFANWFISATRFALFFYIPMFFYLQSFSQSLSATGIGLRLIPESVAIGVTSVLYGIIMKKTQRYYWPGIVSGVAACLGAGLLIPLTTMTPTWLPLLCFVLDGIGFSGMVSVTIIAMIASAEHQYQAVITSISYAFRSTGTTLGITIASAILQNRLTAQLHSRLGQFPDSEDLITKLRNDLGAIQHLPSAWQEAAIQSYLEALRAVFVFLLGTSVVGLASLSLLREHVLHNKISREN